MEQLYIVASYTFLVKWNNYTLLLARLIPRPFPPPVPYPKKSNTGGGTAWE